MKNRKEPLFSIVVWGMLIFTCVSCQHAESHSQKPEGKTVIRPMDSTDIYGNHFKQDIKVYDHNGSLKEHFFQGDFGGNGCLVGTYYKFAKNGALRLRIKIHNDSFDEAYLLYIYYKNGKPSKQRKFKNHFQYEIPIVPFDEKQ